ncbi:MAG: translation initiation factor IF-2 [Thermoguttaceae bacterium]
MPIRIYSLAKQLKLDNKVLVEICNKTGITGKGSALASLSDEEVALIKAYLSGGAKKTGAAGGAADQEAATATRTPTGRADVSLPGAVRREDSVTPVSKKVPVLDRKTEKHAKEAPAEPKSAEVSVEPVVETPTPTEAPQGPVAPASDQEVAPPVTTEPEITPAEATPSAVGPSKKKAEKPKAEPATPPDTAAELVTPEKSTAKVEKPESPPRLERPERPDRPERIPRLDRPDRSGRGKAAKPDRPQRPERSGPAIKLAPMPVVQQPVTPKAKEPAPQKPDLKLPMDAIRASKAGGKPLSEHLRKQEQKRKATGKKGVNEPVAPEAAGETPLTLAAKERAKRGGPDAVVAEEEGAGGGSVGLGGREHRQLKRKRAATARRVQGEDEETPAVVRPTARQLRRTGSGSTAAPRKNNVVIELPCTVRSFAEGLGFTVQQVLGKLLELGVMTTITANLDAETAELLADALGVQVTFRREVDPEEQLVAAFQEEEQAELLQPRPPIVTFLGHVDHGKTSLLDRILGLNVVATEKGGITQHIRAYQITKEGRQIAFVDTPGHEAFTAMRARGANVTDIAVLVVAADDGVMPQTEEAISHARAAGVPIVVALNKIDLPGVNIDRIFQELASNDLLPSEWGGDTEVVRTSAITGQGMDELLDTLLTVADLHEYKANPAAPATGVCLEAEVQQGRGVVAKVLVQKGTLHVGDVVVCGASHGRVKAMYDTLTPYKKYNDAGPSTPVNITGLDIAPGAGDRFYVMKDIAEAREIASERASRTHLKELAGGIVHVTFENLRERLVAEKNKAQTLNIIVRADVRGSIEAIRKELEKLQHPEVQIKTLLATVGGITEGDVHLADASDAVIVGFNVVPDEKARELADRLGVQIRRYDIIYQMTADLKAALEGMLKPERREAELGRALVLQTFHISRVGTVAGCRVLSGLIARDARIRVIRDNRIIGDYPVETLRREKDDAREVREGYECGIKLSGFNDIKEGDVLEAYRIEEIRRTF